ncbi:alpha-tocopherol transfer protein-like [Cloeon dipterum]|uniref:alpha-tocopherol transfer protein-like n=1 Tax=Cloeon dipterum TaxID=197152 RepID=UPI00321F718D
MVDDVGSLKIRPLAPDLLQHAMRELNEDPKKRPAYVKDIRDWLKTQEHIVGVPSDQLIVTFLRGCKFDLDKTKEKLDTYFTIKTLVPEYFKNRDLTKNEQLRKILNLRAYISVPGTDEEGRKIYIMVMGRDEPGTIDPDEAAKFNYMVMDYLLMEDDVAVVMGIVNLTDLSPLTLQHAKQLMPSMMKKTTACSEGGYPFRPKVVHLLNMPSFVDKILEWIEMFRKDKDDLKVYLYGNDLSALLSRVPKKLVPNEFGGEAGTLDELGKEFADKILAFNDWYVADETNGVDENKRVGKSKTREDLLGMNSNFRELDFD